MTNSASSTSYQVDLSAIISQTVAQLDQQLPHLQVQPPTLPSLTCQQFDNLIATW